MKSKVFNRVCSGRFLRYLFLIPLIFVLLSCLFYSAAYEDLEDKQVQQQYISVRQNVEGIVGSIDYMVDKDKDWYVYDYRGLIAHRTELLDAEYMVFSASYDEELQLISHRTVTKSDSPFNPMDYEEFKSSVFVNENGFLELIQIRENESNLKWRLYYSWVPSNNSYEGRYLIVSAVNSESIEQIYSSWVLFGVVCQILFSVVLQVIMIIEVSKLAYKNTE